MSFTEEEMEEIRQKSTEDMTPEEIAALTNREKAIRGLLYDPSIYDANWFNGQAWQRHWLQKILGWLAGEFGPFESSVDLGAGDGYYSHILAEMKAEAVAIEVSEEAMPVITASGLVKGIVHDLREPLDLERTFDLVICMEVAEHIPSSASDVLCDSIARHCANWLVFTAAPPGQGGHGHCNLKPFKFWQDRLECRGLKFQPSATAKIQKAWKNILIDALPWLSRNVTLFRREQ